MIDFKAHRERLDKWLKGKANFIDSVNGEPFIEYADGKREFLTQEFGNMVAAFINDAAELLDKAEELDKLRSKAIDLVTKVQLERDRYRAVFEKIKKELEFMEKDHCDDRHDNTAFCIIEIIDEAISPAVVNKPERIVND